MKPTVHGDVTILLLQTLHIEMSNIECICTEKSTKKAMEICIMRLRIYGQKGDVHVFTIA